ncbi:UvrA [Liquorilactobacillus ghanensis DSM 18630]|uniref:UvrABC system protein A n=1 Tax=Liquorilactobacillus ghanensis DSM 18630 TaxID=1423750 RepID=A0A0R1VUM8_9LACO|nr:excinuclease ABC subunit UvrA [Liquorilactobacillus ghanensis]KRM06422.1 UvrA [Liquorilactobacillus ghanensis DSM 18630]
MDKIYQQGFIEIKNAAENNLQHVDLKIPKYQLTVFTGLSGSGKSSLVFDTLAATSRRELNETFPSFTQQYLPKFGQPQVDKIEHLPVAIVVEQKPIGKNARSTLATYTGIYSLLRLLFSRIGQPWVGYSEHFSFNLPQGMCPKCQGLGYVDQLDEDKIIDLNKSLNDGAITFVSFRPGTWRWKRYAKTGLFDPAKKLKDYSPAEMELLLHAPQQKLKDPPAWWGKTQLYEGLVPRIMRSIVHSAEGKHHQAAIKQVVSRQVCPLCHGERLQAKSLACKINGLNIAEVGALDLIQAAAFLQKIKEPLAAGVIRELLTKIQALIEIGLGYLSLDRSTDTLSGGETQRIKLAKYLTSSLSDLVYILDEPSVGLHPHDIQLIRKALLRLKDQGNTVILVDHNPAIISLADWVVEMGPQAGMQGGKVTFSGTYQQLLHSQTITGKMLRRPLHFKTPRQPAKWLEVQNLRQHNLKQLNVKFPQGVLTVVSGPAGSGKSTLVNAIKQQITVPYIDLDQTSAGINIRSTPATYLKIMDSIRKLFAEANHVSMQLFSYNGKGACPRCKGKGVTITNMAFMDPVVQTCELCHGHRYNPEVLRYQYHGKNIHQVLSLPITAAIAFFADQAEICQKLDYLLKVGLGYLDLSQAMTTLSGGEIQRLRLALELNHQGKFYFLDEPTTGLHLKDTEKLIDLFNQLVDQGNTLILIEHNLRVISQADYLIDLGPDAGKYGGQLCFAGSPQASLKQPRSRTGMALKQAIKEF